MGSEFTNGSAHFDDLDPHQIEKSSSLKIVRERFNVDGSGYKPTHTISYRAHIRPSNPFFERIKARSEERIETNRISYEVNRRLLIDRASSLENALRALDSELHDLTQQLEQLQRDKDAIIQLTGQEIDQKVSTLNQEIQSITEQLKNKRVHYNSQRESIIRSLYNAREQLRIIEENRLHGTVPSTAEREEAIGAEAERLQEIATLNSERAEVENREREQRIIRNQEALEKIQRQMEELNNRIIALQEKLQSQRNEEGLIANGPEQGKDEALKRINMAIRQTETNIRYLSQRMRKHRDEEEKLL